MPRSVSSATHSSSSVRSSAGVKKLDLAANDAMVGRESELETLRSLFLEAKGGRSAIVAIEGAAGVGKSKLIQTAVDRNLFDGVGFFVEAKYSAQQRHQPFSAIVDALSDLVTRLCRQDHCQSVIRSFLATIKEDLFLLKNVLPKIFELAKMSDADIASMSVCKEPQSSEHFYKQNSFRRLSFVLQKLLTFVCRPPEQTVVISLDDVQYMDQSSQEFISFLLQGCASSFGCPRMKAMGMKDLKPIQGLFIVLSYRGDEVPQDSNVLTTMTMISAPFIRLEALNKEHLNELVASWVKRSPQDTKGLANVVFQKTGGNPFAAEKYMEILGDEGYVFFDTLQSYNWTWKDPTEIEQSTVVVAENVADLIVQSMQRNLSPETQIVLMVAACLGAHIPVLVLKEFFAALRQDEEKSDEYVSLTTVSPDQVEGCLMQAVKLGILSFPQTSVFIWAHERVQSAAYSMLQDDARMVHIRLGKLLWETSKASGDSPDWLIFLAAEQINRAVALKGEKVLSHKLALLNLSAAKLCMDKSAFYPALDLLNSAVQALGEEESRWKEHYDLCLDLHTSLAQVNCFLGNGTESTQAIEEVLRHGKTAKDTYAVDLLQASQAAAGSKGDTAMERQKYIAILRKQGGSVANFPSTVGSFRLKREKFALSNRNLGKTWRHVDPQQDVMTDEQVRRLTFLLNRIAISSAALDDYVMAEYCCLRILQLTFDHGLSVHAVSSIVLPCLRLRKKGKNSRVVERYELAKQLGERFYGSSDYSRVMMMTHLHVYHMIHPFHDSLDVFAECHRMAVSVGDMEYAFMATKAYCFVYLNTGLSFKPLEEDISNYIVLALQFRLPNSTLAGLKIFYQTVLNIQGKADDPDHPAQLNGSAMKEDELIKSLEDSAHLSNIMEDMSACRLMLACIFLDPASMESNLQNLAKVALDDKFIARGVFRSCYMGLASILLARTFGKPKYAKLGEKVQKHYAKQVTAGSPNAYPIWLVLCAFQEQSEASFQKAIVACARSGLSQLEAMSREGLGRSLLTQQGKGDEAAGESQLLRAMELYGELGATGKVDQMKKAFSFLGMSENKGSQLSSSIKARARFDPKTARKFEQVDLTKEIGLGLSSKR